MGEGETRNNTVYNPTNMGYFISDGSRADWRGDLSYSYTSVNDGVFSSDRHGFRLDPNIRGTGATLTFTLTNPGSFQNTPLFSPDATDANIVGEVITNPLLGNCRVYIPTTSSWFGAGAQPGENIGATIIYAYNSGVLTTTKLWNTADSGRWVLKGATVSGTNTPGSAGTPMTNPDINTTSDSAHDVHTLLNITSAGCLPGGY